MATTSSKHSRRTDVTKKQCKFHNSKKGCLRETCPYNHVHALVSETDKSFIQIYTCGNANVLPQANYTNTTKQLKIKKYLSERVNDIHIIMQLSIYIHSDKSVIYYKFSVYRVLEKYLTLVTKSYDDNGTTVYYDTEEEIEIDVPLYPDPQIIIISANRPMICSYQVNDINGKPIMELTLKTTIKNERQTCKQEQEFYVCIDNMNI